jgi:7,8-dihydro-6-hydroxymethylpterin-pyrophosphokinase
MVPRPPFCARRCARSRRRLAVEAVSPTIASAPLGPSRRRYANAAAIVAGDLMPPALLLLLSGSSTISAACGAASAGARERSTSM